MKSNVKKLASVLLAAVMLFSMCAVFSVSAAETSDAVGAGLTVTGQSNYGDVAVSPASVNTGGTVIVNFLAPADLNVVSMQWGLNYDKTKLQYLSSSSDADMLVNPNAQSYNILGSASNDSQAVEVLAGEPMLTVRFKALETGTTQLNFTVIDLMDRTAAGDKIIVNNGQVKDSGTSFTVNATSNFFANQTRVFGNVTELEDANGNKFVTVSYMACAEDQYIINIDLDELTYDPAVLEWSDTYNTYGSGRSAVVDIFPFAAENNCGAGTYHLTAPGRLVANYSSVKPAAYASNEDGSPVTVVKATFKVLNPNAGTTTVNCVVDTLSFCDITEKNPYMKSIAVDKKTVNADNKAKAVYSTSITAADGTEEELLLGDVDKNGRVEINDATMLQRYLSEYVTGVDSRVADVNRDGKVNIKDVTEIQRYVAQLITKF